MTLADRLPLVIDDEPAFSPLPWRRFDCHPPVHCPCCNADWRAPGSPEDRHCDCRFALTEMLCARCGKCSAHCRCPFVRLPGGIWVRRN